MHSMFNFPPPPPSDWFMTSSQKSENSSYNRDPRIRVREEERDRMKAEIEKYKFRILSLEAENERLKTGKIQSIIQRQVKEVQAQMTEREAALKAATMETNQLKARIKEVIQTNEILKVKLAVYERQKPAPSAQPSYSLNEVTNNAVRYAVDEYRRQFENREREIESKMNHWQEKADSAVEEICRLQDEVEQLKRENEALRASLVNLEPGDEEDEEVPGVSTSGLEYASERDLPFRKRFKKFP